jgi:hypothetical protein
MAWEQSLLGAADSLLLTESLLAMHLGWRDGDVGVRGRRVVTVRLVIVLVVMSIMRIVFRILVFVVTMRIIVWMRILLVIEMLSLQIMWMLFMCISHIWGLLLL